MVQAVQPDAVVVELCRSRQAYMYEAGPADRELQRGQSKAGGTAPAALTSAGLGGSTDEEDAALAARSSDGSGSSTSSSSSASSGSNAGNGSLSSSGSSSNSSSSGGSGANPLNLSGGGLLATFQRSLELGGTTALLLRLALGRLSAQMSGSLGVQGGAEFVAARQEAEELGAQVRCGRGGERGAVEVAALLAGSEGEPEPSSHRACSASRASRSTPAPVPSLASLPCSWCWVTGRSRSRCSAHGTR